MHNFDAQKTLQAIRDHKKIARQQTYLKSRLNKLRAELVAMRQAGASYPELATWLRQYKRIKMAHTSIMRYLNQLPELKGDTAKTDNSDAGGDHA